MLNEWNERKENKRKFTAGQLIEMLYITRNGSSLFLSIGLNGMIDIFLKSQKNRSRKCIQT